MRARIFLAALLVATPAAATPPRVLSIEDRLVGQSDAAIFVERRLSDNLGYHQTELSDIFLVEIPFDDTTERITPLRTVLEDGYRAYDEGRSVAMEELFLAPTGLHGTLAQRGAAPRGPLPSHYTPQVSITMDGDLATVTLTRDDSTWTLAPMQAAALAWDRTLAARPVERPMSIGPEDTEFYAERCDIDLVREFLRLDSQIHPMALVTCTDEVDTRAARIWIRLSPVP